MTILIDKTGCPDLQARVERTRRAVTRCPSVRNTSKIRRS